MIELIRGIISAYDGQEDGYEMELTGKLLKFWQLLVLNVDRKKGISGKEQKDYERIREILRFIEKNYDKKLTVDQIAENVYMCTSQCSRLFKRHCLTLFWNIGSSAVWQICWILAVRWQRQQPEPVLMTPIIIQRYLCGSRDVRHRCIGRRCGEDRA